MAISWGSWEYASGNGMRVGLDISWTSPSHGSTTSVATVEIYTQNQFKYDDAQTLSYSGFSNNTATNYTNNTGPTTGTTVDTPRLRATKSYTYTYSTYGSSPGTRTFTATVSGAFNGVTPSKSVDSTIPARPATAPGAPTISSSPNNGSISVSYGEPSFYGGSNPPVVGDGVYIGYYQYSTDNVNFATTPSNPFTLSGPNGTAITGYVRAVNNYGIAGASSSTSSTPRTVPGAPGVSSSPANGSISVSYSAPASDGGNAISSYKYSTDNVNFTTTPSNPFSVSGPNGTAITVYVRAVNAAGDSASGSTTNTPRTVAGAPTSFTGNNSTFGQITLSWAAPSDNGGATITSYVLRTGTTILQNANLTSYVHTGLSPYTDYSYTVTAVNASGEGTSASLTVKTMGGIAKVWNGSSWVTVLPKVWNGSSWVNAQARMWNGAEWKHGI